MHASTSLVDALIATGKVVAAGVGGSVAAGTATDGSDIDLYVFTEDRIDPELRREIAIRLADNPDEAEIANAYWGDEDGYAIDGVWHDIVFFDRQWFLDQIDRVMVFHQAADGYSTAFVHTLAHMQVIHDPAGMLTTIKRQIENYPDELARAIIRRNYTVACVIHPSYRNQIARAVELKDAISVNHRVAAFLACATDIAFASLRQWHPGEKRQLQWLDRQSDSLPEGFTESISEVLMNTAPDRLHHLPKAVDQVALRLQQLAEQELA